MGFLSAATKAAQFVADQAQRPHLPVSQSAVNAALTHFTRDIQEVRNVSVCVHDGHFDLSADIVRGPDARYEGSFKVAQAHVSGERQFLVLDEIGQANITGQTVTGKLVWGFVGAFFSTFTDTNPVRFAAPRAPGVVVNGTFYTVDLSAYDVHHLIHRTAALQPFLRADTHIKDVGCRDGHFNVYFGADVERLKEEAEKVKGEVAHVSDKVRKVTSVLKRLKRSHGSSGAPPDHLPGQAQPPLP